MEEAETEVKKGVKGCAAQFNCLVEANNEC